MSDELTYPDQVPGARHPRETAALVGHEEAETALAEGLASGRMHHAWLLTGPSGVGKATLAYRFARRALGAPQTGAKPFDVDMESPPVRRMLAQAHPDLFVLRRGLNDQGKPKRDISADDARELSGFFTLKPAEGGCRIAIIDAVDEFNRHAANAILKVLEEPPPRAVILLVCHAPGAALATIRSRCRRLALRPLSEPELAEATHAQLGQALEPAILAMAGGRPGRALRLAAAGAADLDAKLSDAFQALAKRGARAFEPVVFGPAGGDPLGRFDLVIDLAQARLRTRTIEGAEAPRAAAPWAEAYQALEILRGQVEGLTMDPQQGLMRLAQIVAAAGARA